MKQIGGTYNIREKNKGDTNKNQLFFHNNRDIVNKMKTFKMPKI